MFAALRRHWLQFRADPPGQRFERRHRRRGATHRGTPRKLLVVGAGAVLAIVGLALLVLPGPGLLCLAIGAALIAEESLVAARGFDRLDAAAAAWLQLWRRRR